MKKLWSLFSRLVSRFSASFGTPARLKTTAVILILCVAVVFAARIAATRADAVRTLRADAERLSRSFEAIAAVQNIVHGKADLVVKLNALFLPVTEAALLSDRLGRIAQDFLGSSATVHIGTLTPGTVGGDIRAVSFTITGEATARDLGLLLDRFAQLPFLLRITGVSFEVSENALGVAPSTITGEVFVRVETP